MIEVGEQWYEAGPSWQREDLRSALVAMIDAYRSRFVLLTASHEMALYDAALRDEFAAAFAAYFDALAERIRRGQASGDIVPTLRPLETAQWLVWMLERAPSMLGRDVPADLLARHVDAATDVFWTTLYANAPNRTR